ncbi:MAG: DUF99 family protein [Desulfurococcales archaeon]|nr:DUF99 family protein [Desulfurococcales archaeon]
MPSEGVVACDDGRVAKLGEGYTIVLCIAWSYRHGPLDGAVLKVRVDGLDASSQVAFLVSMLKRSIAPEALLLDSLTMAGFNLVSPPAIAKLAGVPTIVVYTYKPSLKRLREALVKNFRDWGVRLRVLALVDTAYRVRVDGEDLYIVSWGVDRDKAREVLYRLRIYSRKPEPLRLAHYLASEISRILL